MNIKEVLKNIARSILKDELIDLDNQINELNSQIDKHNLEFKSNKDWELSERLINDYPSNNIYYNGRTLPNSKTLCEVPVNVLVTKNDPRIIQDLKKWGFYNSTEDWETLIPKVYKKIHETYYKYAYDSTVWGAVEIWEFPFELFQKYPKGKISADCDSWSHFQVSYYRALGLPAGFVWITVGDTFYGGHSTVYIYSKKDDRFHHLNSTYGQIYDTISEYPTHSDAMKGEEGTDGLGIYRVWFSFNDLVSRSTFSESEIKNLLNK